MKNITLSLILAALAAPGFAQNTQAPLARVEMLPGWRMADGHHMAALHIELEEGWKTYWRAPGEAGLPPGIDWSGSQNVAAVDLHWPVPEVVRSNGMTTLGYHGELVLPVEITPADPDQEIALTGAIEMGICQDVCMPFQAEVSAALPEAGEHDPRIAAALEDQPAASDVAGLVSANCTVEPISDGLRVTAALELPQVGLDEVTVFEPDDRAIWVSEAMQERQGGRLTATADLVPPTAEPFELDTKTLRLTVIADGHAVDIQGCTRLE